MKPLEVVGVVVLFLALTAYTVTVTYWRLEASNGPRPTYRVLEVYACIEDKCRVRIEGHGRVDAWSPVAVGDMVRQGAYGVWGRSNGVTQ